MKIHKSNLLVTIAIAVVTFSFWAWINRPETEPAWPDRIQGFSFAPMRLGNDPTLGLLPSVDEIDEDLALLADKTYAVRTYTVEGPLGEIPRLARKHGINVALGAWISGDPEKDRPEVEKLIQLASANRRNVVRVFVGNEALLRGDLSVEELAVYLERARQELGVPVSTAEPWHVWIKNPELVEHVDFLAVHMLPYWEGVEAETSIDYIMDRLKDLATAFPGKPIVVAEVGWPSNGRTRRSAVASVSNQGMFLRRFLQRAEEAKLVYYLMEAFDQPWKRESEGAVGAYWGVWDAERRPKFEFSRPIVEIPQWRLLAGLSVVIAAITLAFLLVDSRSLRRRGRSFLAVVAYAAASAAVWVTYDYTQQYLTVQTVIVGALLILGMIGVIAVLLTEAHEWAEALWTRERRRPFRPLAVDDEDLPFVSVHVPAYNEPPDMLAATLQALALLDYPRFEVLVVDNNTQDPAVWQPVEALCRELGPRFRFFHVDPLAGFKAGALNFALEHTAAETEIVAVIDSDYVVHPRWLRDLAPQFRQPEVAIVQAPQDYRDSGANLFKAMCYAEYRGFFYVGMITRNERNAIIQHGTMTMVRRRDLEEAGRWGDWCITEDAELGLRIFERGRQATYIPRSYGRGLMPDRFIDYKKQRYRWAYGAVQILRRHAGSLLRKGRSKLTLGQRYHFVAGWLPWIADGINLLFNLAAIGWSLAMIAAPRHVDPPLPIFAILPLALFVFKAGKLVYLYRTRVGASLTQTMAAAIAGLSLAHTIARAVLSGMVTSKKPFFRTPKMEHAGRLRRSLAAAREEILILTALWLAAYGILQGPGTDSPDMILWVVMLMTQSLSYATSLLMAVVAGFPRLPAGGLGKDWPTPSDVLGSAPKAGATTTA
jgi:exo-beta-1,3-glucanase (GH17 family)/cellulose synthase/poly-beta-1,6-N-acetylglucosamine synthase-like glycosyltransferase